MAGSPRRVPTEVSDRRSQDRHILILRAGILEQDGKPSFCLARNISASGIQVKLYAPATVGRSVLISVGDESAIPGTIVWVRNGIAGIHFDEPIEPATLFRLEQSLRTARRRSIPRIRAEGDATVRVKGRKLKAELCDISSSGARLRTSAPLEVGSIAIVALPDMPELNAFVRWTDDREAGLLFQTPIPMQVIAKWIAERSELASE